MPSKRTQDLEVFISHSHNDNRIAEALVHFLIIGVGIENNDVRCTSYRPTGLTIGTSIANQLRKDLEECRVFMPLITSNTAGSEFVAFEIGAAWALETSITPLVYGLVNPTMPALLNGLMYCDLKSLGALVQLAQELSVAIFDRPYPTNANQMLAAAQMFLKSTAA